LNGCERFDSVANLLVPSMILAIHGTNEHVLQCAQNMRVLMRKNAGRPGIDNEQYICGFPRDRPRFPTKFMQKSTPSPMIAFCCAVLSF
jgi:hypothetical protein